MKGKLEDWKLEKKLALRTNLGQGQATINNVVVPLSISLNVDGKALFIEFPDSIVVTYLMEDVVKDAVSEYEAYLANLEKLKKMEEPTNPNAKIPWCNLGYTVQQSKEKCPLEGCWKFRCFNSKLHNEWSKGRVEWRKQRYEGKA